MRRTIRCMRNSEYFQSLEPINVAEELAHYGVSAATLAECVASCGCCVSVDAWSKVGDRDAWFEVWWLWLIHNATIKELAGLSTNTTPSNDPTDASDARCLSVALLAAQQASGHTWSFVEQLHGASLVRISRVTNGIIDAALKWSIDLNDQTLRLEAGIAPIMGTDGPTGLIAAATDPVPFVLTKFATAVRTRFETKDALEAMAVLAALHTTPFPPVPVVKWSNMFNAPPAMLKAAMALACPGDEELGKLLTEAYLEALHCQLDEPFAHRDTHPRNWVLTQEGPALLDFANAGPAPVGFDEVMLVAHLDLPVAERLALIELAGVPRHNAALFAGAVAARTALVAGAADPYWRAWFTEFWGPLRVLAAALLTGPTGLASRRS